jgi:hypothetical protein
LTLAVERVKAMNYQSLTDKELLNETETQLRAWNVLSVHGFKGSQDDAGAMCDALYDEANRRGKPELYNKAYERVFSK